MKSFFSLFHCTAPPWAKASSRHASVREATLPRPVPSHVRDVTTDSVPATTGRLQGKNIQVTDMYSHITAIEVKLCLWEAQLAAGEFMHFSCIPACAPDDVDLNTCVGVVISLREEFASHFTCVRPLSSSLRALSCSPSPWTKPLSPCR